MSNLKNLSVKLTKILKLKKSGILNKVFKPFIYVLYIIITKKSRTLTFEGSAIMINLSFSVL